MLEASVAGAKCAEIDQGPDPAQKLLSDQAWSLVPKLNLLRRLRI